MAIHSEGVFGFSRIGFRGSGKRIPEAASFYDIAPCLAEMPSENDDCIMDESLLPPSDLSLRSDLRIVHRCKSRVHFELTGE
jgi:hypothetical protein